MKNWEFIKFIYHNLIVNRGILVLILLYFLKKYNTIIIIALNIKEIITNHFIRGIKEGCIYGNKKFHISIGPLITTYLLIIIILILICLSNVKKVVIGT